MSNLTQFGGSSGPAGLTLKAWGLFNGSTGALIKGSGLAFNSKGGTGFFALTVTGGLIPSINQCVVRGSMNQAGGIPLIVNPFATSTTAITVDIRQLATGTATDPASFHVEVWA